MSFNIHGFDKSATPGQVGVIVFRWSEPAPKSTIDALASALESGSPESTGTVAAFRWRVPSQDEQSAQKRAIEDAAGDAAEAWAFSQSVETDLTDWFAPRWRTAPAAPGKPSFDLGDPPEVVTWEGFGISLRFDTDIGDAEAEVIGTMAELWLAGLSDRTSAGVLGPRAFRRSIIARRGSRRVVVGVEGLANPGTDADAVNHILGLAERIAKVLPLRAVDFLSLLPHDGDTAEEDLEPSSQPQRATREWRPEDLQIGDDTSVNTASIDTLLDGDGSDLFDSDAFDDEPATGEVRVEAAADVTEPVEHPAELPAEEDDGWGDADTAHLQRDEVEAALSVLDEMKEIEVEEAATETPSPTNGVTNGVSAGAPHEGEADLATLQSAIEAGDLEATLAAFDGLGDPADKSAAAEILLDAAESLDPSDWDEIPILLELTGRIIPTEPESSNAHLLAIAALCRLGRGPEAIDLGLAHQQRPEVLYELYERLCVFRRIDETPALYAALAEHGHEGVGDHYYNLGCKLHPNQPEIALALYQGAIAVGSPSPQAEINAGIALMSLGRTAEAAELTRTALESHPEEPNLWATLIDLETRLGAEQLPASLETAITVIGNSSRCGDCEASAPASCSIGCGALLADCVDAMGADRASEALELIARFEDDTEATLRVLCAKAQALAASGDLTAAREILSRHISTEDATGPTYYRSRANLEHLAGNEQVALGLAIAAIHGDSSITEQMRRDPIGGAISGLVIPEDGTPPRPPTVPEGARWIASDGEWEVGDIDEAGAKQGTYRYYRVDGSMCNECTLVNDTPNGAFVRYHESGEISQQGSFVDGALDGTRVWIASNETTSEQMHGAQISPLIRRSEMDYVAGRVVGVRHFNAEGALCAPNGEPYPDRPGDVTEDAFFRADDRQWVAGEVDDDGQRRGVWRVWNDEGVLLEESEYLGGERHGSFKAYFADGSLSAEGQYEADEKRGTFVYQRRGDQEHEDFPMAATTVVVAEESHETQMPHVRLYDRTGRETTIDGTPLEEWTEVHPALGDWYTQVWQVPWPELDDASGSAHRIPHILVGLLSKDTEISDFVYQALYWHLYHQGTVYAATAAALPFLIELSGHVETPHRATLVNFIRHAAVYPSEALEEALGSGDHAVVSTNDALRKRLDVFVSLVSDPDPGVRAASGAIVAGGFHRADELASELSGALASESDDMVRASHMFSLARLGTPEALFVVEAQLGDTTPLVGASAAMAMVMARGEEAGARVADRLVTGLLEYTDEVGEGYARSPWSDDHIITEMAQALHYASEGNTALDTLCGSFETIESADGIAAVAAALMIAISSGEGLSPEVIQVLTAIADCERLWRFNEALSGLLEGYELPVTPEGLRELVS